MVMLTEMVVVEVVCLMRNCNWFVGGVGSSVLHMMIFLTNYFFSHTHTHYYSS